MNPRREMIAAIGSNFSRTFKSSLGTPKLGNPRGIVPTTLPPPISTTAFSSIEELPIFTLQVEPSPFGVLPNLPEGR
jgi:hypothetical protein